MMSVVPWRRQARTLASTWALRPMCALRRRHSKTRAAFAAARSTLASRASLSSPEMVAMAAVSSSVKTTRFPAPSAAVTASTPRARMLSGDAASPSTSRGSVPSVSAADAPRAPRANCLSPSSHARRLPPSLISFWSGSCARRRMRPATAAAVRSRSSPAGGPRHATAASVTSPKPLAGQSRTPAVAHRVSTRPRSASRSNFRPQRRTTLSPCARLMSSIVSMSASRRATCAGASRRHAPPTQRTARAARMRSPSLSASRQRWKSVSTSLVVAAVVQNGSQSTAAAQSPAASFAATLSAFSA